MIQKIINALTAPIRKHCIFYIAMLALFGISALFVQYYGSRKSIILEIFFDAYAVSLIVALMPKKWQKIAKYILFALFTLIGMIDMVCYKTTGIAISPNIMTTWLQTNSNEAFEAFSSYITYVLISPAILFLLLPLCIWWLKRIGFTINRHIALFIAGITIISTVYGIENKIYIYKTHALKTDDTMVMVCDYKEISREYLPHYRLLYSVKEISRFSNMRESLEKNMETAQIDSCSFDSPIIVLLIGESYNRHHSSLYGYDKETTPRQQQMFNNGELYRFNDVISSYNLTFKSFQNMLSLYNYDKKHNWYDYPLVTTLFRKAGYEVSFFSNQFCLDKRSSLSEIIDDMFINNEKLSKHMFDKRNAKTCQYDLGLIDEYKQLCDTASSAPQLVIFSFIGMHAEFSKRYPPEFAKFDAEDYIRKDLNTKEIQTIAEYDNAILYNDFVVDSIVHCFKEREAIIIHVPDHGELVYDNTTLFGRKLQLEKTVVPPQYDIPFTIYCSPSYKEKHNDICRMIEASTERPFMTDDLAHLLLFLAGIKCEEYDESRNLIDENFNEERKRLICGEVDYDILCN